MKSTLRIFVLLLVFAFVLSACGGTTAPAKTYTADDFKSVTLGASDFPAGFDMLTPEDAASMGLDLASFESSLKAFTAAKPVNTVVAMNQSFDKFQFVAVFVVAPMTESEVSNFDKELSNSEKARTEFAEGLGGTATFLSGAEGIGDKSIGFDLTIESSGVVLRGELVMSRRGVGMQMIVLLYLDGVQKEVSAVDLAKKIDGMLAGVQK